MPRCAQKFNLKEYFNMSDEILKYIIINYTYGESGVRTLEKHLYKILGCISIWTIDPNVLSIQNCNFKDDITEKCIDSILKSSENNHNVSHTLMYS